MAEVGGDETLGGVRPEADFGNLAIATVAETSRASGPISIIEAVRPPRRALVRTVVEVFPGVAKRDELIAGRRLGEREDDGRAGRGIAQRVRGDRDDLFG